MALSTCEAELYAKAAAIQEVLWLRGLMKELGLHRQLASAWRQPVNDRCAKNGIKGERTKHVDVKYHFITETVEEGRCSSSGSPLRSSRQTSSRRHWPRLFHHFRKQLMTR